MALLSVGFGAVLFAPKSRFMAAMDWWRTDGEVVAVINNLGVWFGCGSWIWVFQGSKVVVVWRVARVGGDVWLGPEMWWLRL